jgi:hypothetical protein
MGENLCLLFMDKGLITRIYKELKKLNIKRRNKWQESCPQMLQSPA